MTKIKKPEEIFAEITEDYKKIFGDDLISIILYGSGTGNEFQPGKSDLNFLIILSDETIDHLDRAIETVSRWRKKKVATPLFMTKSYIESSLDSYPLEFLNIKKNYILVYGEDVLKDISLEAHHLRLQCEREIKGKLLLLREGFLETEGKQKRIKELINASITAFISIFSGLLYLKGIEIPLTRREIIQFVAKEIPINQEIFMRCLDIKQDKKKFSSSEIKDIFKTYVVEIRKLWEVVDKMEI
ncbi:MAG: hypothetical protein E3J28_01840 [Desulfobacteraceae bacterium]|nr:MAG: hypothetical protein E3J28_01840 [Desulfobacteraceae bacterium]